MDHIYYYTAEDDLYNLLIESLIYLVLYNNTPINTDPIKHIITDEVINNLILIKFKDASNKENNTTCAITLNEFNEDDMIIQLPCNHCFNSDAILHWLTEESCECPVCRYKLESKEKKGLSSTPSENFSINYNINPSENIINSSENSQINIQYYFN